MQQFFFPGLAQRYDVPAAIVAQYLRDELQLNLRQRSRQCHGIVWTQQSLSTLAANIQYLSRHSIRRALQILRSSGLIIREQLDKRHFNHSYWYAFTPTGQSVMEELEETEL
jgi:hypothetical protein